MDNGHIPAGSNPNCCGACGLPTRCWRLITCEENVKIVQSHRWYRVVGVVGNHYICSRCGIEGWDYNGKKVLLRIWVIEEGLTCEERIMKGIIDG